MQSWSTRNVGLGANRCRKAASSVSKSHAPFYKGQRLLLLGGSGDCMDVPLQLSKGLQALIGQVWQYEYS